MNVQAAGWGHPPAEVLQGVMQCLPQKQVWSVRHVGKHWATAARHSARFGVTILTPRSSIRSKLGAINRLPSYPNVQLVLQLDQAQFMHDSADLLTDLQFLVRASGSSDTVSSCTYTF